MTKLLGIAGHQMSGKNTAANWIFGQGLISLNLVDWIKIGKRGQLIVPAISKDDEIVEGVFDCFDPVTYPVCQHIWPLVKLYSFANPLKEFCMNVLNLSYEQCFGTNINKNSLTDLLWENMPGVTTNKHFYEDLSTITDTPEQYLIYHEPGRMTAREVMQFFGTDVIRRMYFPAWVNATIRQIKREKSELAVITDVRFVNEVEAIQKAGGRVIKLTRQPVKSTHSSEKDLDDFDKFDYVCDNRRMTILDQNEDITNKLIEWRYLPWQTEIESN